MPHDGLRSGVNDFLTLEHLYGARGKRIFLESKKNKEIYCQNDLI